MDFSAATPSTSSPTASVSDQTTGILWGRGRGIRGSIFADFVDKLICVVVTIVFTVVGLIAGAITGGLIGLATESGFFRGAGIGAISGAVFSIEVVESSLALWHSNESGIRSVLYVVDVIGSLLSGSLVREKIGPAVQSAVQSQMSAVDSPFIEVLDIFETGSTRGMSKDSIENLPTIKITEENILDESRENICCSVCLQDFELSERARRLPHCLHMFHISCIDTWLIKHGSCPLCRRDL